jgi:hypothetical protein
MHRTREDLGMFRVKQSQRGSSEISHGSLKLRVICHTLLTYYIVLTFEHTITCIRTVSVRQLFRFEFLFETAFFSHRSSIKHDGKIC